jgi:hypothetical protein
MNRSILGFPVEIMFVRDADSRINERDEWCIREFIQSQKMFN